MTTMTQRVPFADARHHPATTAVLIVAFWLAAAALAGTAHVELDPLSSSGGAVAAIASVFLAAYAYTQLCARNAGMSHALGVGTAWLTLAIVVEIAMTTHLRHGWYALLGSPTHPLLRNLFLFVWVFAPAFFARRELET
ncbi:MAG TPA: hypothetical protein VF787_15625 [Thermoanaerobaculia bacterium]